MSEVTIQNKPKTRGVTGEDKVSTGIPEQSAHCLHGSATSPLQLACNTATGPCL